MLGRASVACGRTPVLVPCPVDISVTTAAGTSAAVTSDKFAYVACVVPKLKGKTLKAAKKRLNEAHCKLGKVKGHRSKRAMVRKQSATPGKVLRSGSKINVRVG